jgi:hypothetical protein
MALLGVPALAIALAAFAAAWREVRREARGAAEAGA